MHPLCSDLPAVLLERLDVCGGVAADQHQLQDQLPKFWRHVRDGR